MHEVPVAPMKLLDGACVIALPDPLEPLVASNRWLPRRCRGSRRSGPCPWLPFSHAECSCGTSLSGDMNIRTKFKEQASVKQFKAVRDQLISECFVQS